LRVCRVLLLLLLLFAPLQGRNKRDARQVAAAACVEALLAPVGEGGAGVSVDEFMAATQRQPPAAKRAAAAATAAAATTTTASAAVKQAPQRQQWLGDASSQDAERGEGLGHQHLAQVSVTCVPLAD
jgi:hypothetical protein